MASIDTTKVRVDASEFIGKVVVKDAREVAIDMNPEFTKVAIAVRDGRGSCKRLFVISIEGGKLNIEDRG